jgi:hypothetical protein
MLQIGSTSWKGICGRWKPAWGGWKLAWANGGALGRERAEARARSTLHPGVLDRIEGHLDRTCTIVNVFEPSAEVIYNGKSAKPNEFGKVVKLREAENQI